MSYPFQEVKARVALEDLIRAEGIVLKRSGSRFMCLSPFQKERHASCAVYPEQGRFKCYSSGHSGDIFDYVMLTHNCSKESAMTFLAEKAGLDLDRDAPRRIAPLPPRAKIERADPKPLHPMEDRDLLVWREGVTNLLSKPDLIQWVAFWRGFRVETIRAMAEASLMGVVRLSGWLRSQDFGEGDRRVAFAVNGFIQERAGDQAVWTTPALLAYHVRLKPPPGETKCSWRFQPSGVGSWPFVLGEMAGAKLMVICEGQWDAMAVFDAMTFSSVEQLKEAGVAIVGCRGAGSWRMLAEHFLLTGFSAEAIAAATSDERAPDAAGRMRRTARALRPELTILLICDGDTAGHNWSTRQDEDMPCFAEVLEVVAGRVEVFEPLEANEGGLGKDLNDVLKVLKEIAKQ